MAQFSAQLSASSNGLTPPEWHKKFIEKLDSKGEDLIGVENSHEKIKRKFACLVFGDIEVQIKGNKSNHNYHAPLITSKPLFIGDIRICSPAIDKIDGFQHHLLESDKRYAILPLYDIGGTKSKVTTLETSVSYVNSGNYGSSHHISHIANAYLSGIKNIIWSICKEKKADNVYKFAKMASYLVKAADSVFHNPQTNKSFECIKPYWDSDNIVDTLSKAVSEIFNPDISDKESILRMVEICFKRWVKRNNKSKSEHDVIVRTIPGIIGILVIIPILKELCLGNSTIQKTSDKINNSTMELMTFLANNLESQGKKLNKMFLHKMFKMGNLIDISLEQCGNLLEFCYDSENYFKFYPLRENNLIINEVIPFDLSLKDFKVKGKNLGTRTKIKKLSENKYRIVSTNATKWTGVQLGNGIYILEVKPVAGAEYGIGNTLGKNRVTNIRFTNGKDVLPKKGGACGKSSAGMYYDGFTYKQRNKLELNKKFRIKVNKGFVIEQNGEEFYSQKLEDRKFITIGYKFSEIFVSYFPLEDSREFEVKSQPPGGMPVLEKKELTNIQGLTGMALMEKLAKLKIMEN